MTVRGDYEYGCVDEALGVDETGSGYVRGCLDFEILRYWVWLYKCTVLFYFWREGESNLIILWR